MILVTLPVPGSSRSTVRSSELATHTAAGVIAMPAGPEPTATGPLGLAGGRVDPGHRAVLAVGDPDGVRADRDPVREPPDRDIPHRHVAGRRIDPVYGGITLVGDPDAAGARWRWRPGHCRP